MPFEVRPDGTIIAPDEETAISLSRKLRRSAARSISVVEDPPVILAKSLPEEKRQETMPGHHE